jgi:protein-glutamine gamma-glutamyltransferase
MRRASYMNLKLARELASRFLALAGVLSILITGEFSGLLSTAVVAGLALSFLQLVWLKGPWLSRRTWNVLNLIVIVYFIVDLLIISQSLLVASTRFTIFLMLNKLFNLKTSQDFYQLYLISLLQLLAASTFTNDISFAGVFIVYLIAALWALLLHHLVVQAETHGSALTVYGLSAPFFIATNLIALLALSSTLLLFFIFPRIGMGFFKKGRADLIGVSGFSEQVKLGEVGRVKLDSTIVMRAQLSWKGEQPEFPIVYWRGMVYDYYDGRSWKNTFGKGSALPRKFGGEFVVRRYDPSHPLLIQKIMLEPLDTSVLFALSQPVTLKGRFTMIKANTAHSLHLPYTPSTRLSYTAYSQIPTFQSSDARLKTVDLPARIADYYLQLPTDSARIVKLAQEVTRPARTVYERIRLVERFLKMNYRYSLDIEPASGETPIEDFLFNQKKGYCEQYATAMVLLLRAVDVPARLVSGFLHGDWNEYGDYLTVRNSDAHTWVEIWFPKSGWISFDPTPNAPGKEPVPILAAMVQFIDSLHWKWNRYIVSYSLQDQITVVKEVRSQGSRLRDTLYTGWVALRESVLGAIPGRLHLDAGKIVIGIMLGVVIFIAFLISLYRWKWQHVRRRWTRSKNPHTVEFYERLLSLLAQRGLTKSPSATPLEFCHQLEPNWMAPYVKDLTALYYHVRFGRNELTSQEIKRVQDTFYHLQHPSPDPAIP